MTAETIIIDKPNLPKRIELEIREPRVVVVGDSGSGKTYIVQMIKEAKKTNPEYRRVITVNDCEKVEETIRKINNGEYKDNIIIVDDTDLIMDGLGDKGRELLEAIKNDYSNKYILFGRTLFDAGVTLNGVAKVDI